MSSTMSEKILARASGNEKVEAGDIIIANIDFFIFNLRSSWWNYYITSFRIMQVQADEK